MPLMRDHTILRQPMIVDERAVSISLMVLITARKRRLFDLHLGQSLGVSSVFNRWLNDTVEAIASIV